MWLSNRHSHRPKSHRTDLHRRQRIGLLLGTVGHNPPLLDLLYSAAPAIFRGVGTWNGCGCFLAGIGTIPTFPAKINGYLESKIVPTVGWREDLRVNMSVTFRRFAREDLNPLLELINQANQMDGAGWFFTGIDLLDALLKDEPIPAKDRIWLATDGDMLAGYYRLASEWVQDGLKATCYGCVHPTYRRLGIGTRLIQHALAITDQHRPQPKHLLFQVPARRSVAGIYALCEQNGLTMARQFNVLKRNAHLALNNCHTRWDGQIKPFACAGRSGEMMGIVAGGPAGNDDFLRNTD